MDKALWYLLTATRGGENRARIIRALSERPRNANQLADVLDVRYKTIRHHLDMLEDHGVVESGDNEYGKLYFITDRFEQHRESFEEIMEQIETDDAGVETNDTETDEAGTKMDDAKIDDAETESTKVDGTEAGSTEMDRTEMDRTETDGTGER